MLHRNVTRLRPAFRGAGAAGLCARRKDPATGEWTLPFTIITHEARDSSGEVHDRMPVFLEREVWDEWLQPAKLDGPQAIATTVTMLPYSDRRSFTPWLKRARAGHAHSSSTLYAGRVGPDASGRRRFLVQRVPWERYVGEDVEAVVAMMVNLEHPNSTRVTPSKGDGGIDILDDSAGPDGGDVVYQVKRYAAPLKAKQKREVEKSLGRLLGENRDPRWAGRNITQWRLVLPWDPTPEALLWLNELAAKYGVEAIWDGLTTVDRWCASHPEVVDYYLEGGSQRLEGAYRQAMAFTSLGDPLTQGLDVRALATRVQESLQGPLSRDPHYHYAFRFGIGEPVPAAPGAGLMMSSTAIRDDGWYAIDIYPRCAASPVIRPITIDATFSAPVGSAQADTLRRFFEYGEVPEEPLNFVGELDAPGGLSATLTDATALMLQPSESVRDEGDELRLEILDALGEVLAACHVDRVRAGSGTKGGSFILRDTSGVFDVIGHVDVGMPPTGADGSAPGEAAGERAQLKLKLRPEGLTGATVMTVSDAVSLIAQFHEPNQLRLGSRHLPAPRGATAPLTGLSPVLALVEVAAAVHALRTIQQHAAQVVRVPDLAEHREQIPTWARVARVLEGERVRVRYPDGHVLFFEEPEDFSDPLPEGLRAPMPLEVQIGSETLHLGSVVLEIDTPTLHSRSELPNGTFRLAFTTPDRAVFWTLHDPHAEVADSSQRPDPENGPTQP